MSMVHTYIRYSGGREGGREGNIQEEGRDIEIGTTRKYAGGRERGKKHYHHMIPLNTLCVTLKEIPIISLNFRMKSNGMTGIIKPKHKPDPNLWMKYLM